jgi:predicted peptidase
MAFPRFISTTDVPPKCLQSAKLVGKIPFKALKSDQRVSYTLYIPPEHLNPDPSRQRQGSELDPVYSLLPLVLSIHGTDRSAGTCRDRLIDLTHSESVAILAPLFPAGIEIYNNLDNYKLLKYKTMRSDLMLLDMLDEVGLRWPGIETQKVFIIGYSGGGQFVHRFMYLHPEKLLAVSIGVLGRATALDEGLKWPDGVRNWEDLFGAGTVANKEVIKNLPIQLVVGPEDNVVHGGDEFWKWLQEKKQELAREKGIPKAISDVDQGKPRIGRLDGMKALQLTLQADRTDSKLDVADGVQHDSGGVLHVVKAFLTQHVRAMSR